MIEAVCNPLHDDEEVAQATRFRGIVVKGGITSAVLNAVVAEDLPEPGTSASLQTVRTATHK